MDTKALDRTLGVLALLSCLTVAAMVVGIATMHFGQEVFQVAAPVDQLTALLAGNPQHAFALRYNLGLDNFFLIAYAAFFVFLAVRVRDHLHPWVVGVALAGLLTTAILDAAENHHILLMLRSAEQGLPIAQWQSELQQVLSQLKFHASYVGSFLFAIGMWRMGGLGKWIAGSLCAYIPMGVLISVLSPDTARPLVLARTVFFVGAFLLSSIFFFRRAMKD